MTQPITIIDAGNTEPLVASPTVEFISRLLEEVSQDPRRIDALRKDRRMSTTKLLGLAKNEGLHLTMNSLIGDPDINPLFRRLKFAVEEITLTKEEVAIKFSTLIEELTAFREQCPEVNTSSKLWTSNSLGRALYEAVSSDPHAPYIWRLAGLIEGRNNYDYWSDRDLVLAAVSAGTFTRLKISDDRLHRQIKGRRLEATLACAEPSFANHFYVGHQGELYRSQPELVAGNYFVLRGIDHRHEVRTGVKRADSTRSMVADFLILPINRYVEIAQNRARDRGHRREIYADRLNDKNLRHTEAGMAPIIFDSDPYFVRGVLDVDAMAVGLRDEMLKHGIDIGDPPSAPDLVYSNDETKRRILQDSVENLWIHFEKLEIKTVARLQNHFSHILTCLRMRPDYPAILSKMKENSSRSRSQKTRQRHSQNRQLYAPIQEVRDFFKEHGIVSQPQWNQFSKANPDLLKARKIPANLYSVYSYIGSWISWPNLYPGG